MREFAELLAELELKGVRLMPDADGGLLFHPAELPAPLIERMRRFKPLLLHAARERAGCAVSEALYVLNERLGVGIDLNQGAEESVEIAMREARRALAGVPPDLRRSREPDLIDHALKVFEEFGGLVCTKVERLPTAGVEHGAAQDGGARRHG